MRTRKKEGKTEKDRQIDMLGRQTGTQRNTGRKDDFQRNDRDK